MGNLNFIFSNEIKRELGYWIEKKINFGIDFYVFKINYQNTLKSEILFIINF